GRAVASDYPAAAGAALSDTDSQLLAAPDAARAFRQLAAGSSQQLPCPASLPREDARDVDRGGPDRRDVGVQPVRLLPRAVGRTFSLLLRTATGQAARAVPRAMALRSAPGPLCGLDPAGAHPHRRFSRRAEPPSVTRGPLHHPARAGRPDDGGDARARKRFLP